MSRKAFNIYVELDIHAVTCPGTWLYPIGKVILRVTMLGTKVRTSSMTPVFPLLYHEKFIFQKTFSGSCCLSEVERIISQEVVLAELVQWPDANADIVLASFETTLLELLYPSPCDKGLISGVDVDLLMEPSPKYPTYKDECVDPSPSQPPAWRTASGRVYNSHTFCKTVNRPERAGLIVDCSHSHKKEDKYIPNDNSIFENMLPCSPRCGQTSSTPKYDTRHCTVDSGKADIRHAANKSLQCGNVKLDGGTKLHDQTKFDDHTKPSWKPCKPAPQPRSCPPGTAKSVLQPKSCPPGVFDEPLRKAQDTHEILKRHLNYAQNYPFLEEKEYHSSLKYPCNLHPTK
uniref:Spermatogenesis-associated protein 6 N-terminal domain-containing protein n=1 Tax=Timema shepardi TaxID=629360 RepID=A0A7R9AQP7_TIMSH|nr:unnamed protein product [Timema shepardi]